MNELNEENRIENRCGSAVPMIISGVRPLVVRTTTPAFVALIAPASTAGRQAADVPKVDVFWIFRLKIFLEPIHTQHVTHRALLTPARLRGRQHPYFNAGTVKILPTGGDFV
jgi:hypothetical protein